MAKAERAFALKDNVKDLAGANVAHDGRTVDVKARLESGGGTIRTDDQQLAESLAALDCLKEVSAKKESGKS